LIQLASGPQPGRKPDNYPKDFQKHCERANMSLVIWHNNKFQSFCPTPKTSGGCAPVLHQIRENFPFLCYFTAWGTLSRPIIKLQLQNVCSFLISVEIWSFLSADQPWRVRQSTHVWCFQEVDHISAKTTAVIKQLEMYSATATELNTARAERSQCFVARGNWTKRSFVLTNGFLTFLNNGQRSVSHL